MESKSEALPDMAEFIDPMQAQFNLPSNKYSQCILKRVVGDDRAHAVLQSMSMTVIPN